MKMNEAECERGKAVFEILASISSCGESTVQL
jgi:hypothetical protein